MRSIFLGLVALLVLSPASLAYSKTRAADKTEKTTPSPTPSDFTPSVKFTGFAQFWDQWVQNGAWDMKVAHARLRTTASIDEKTTLVLMPDLSPTGFTLLDAYAQRTLGNGWSVLAGQFKPAFGDDRYLSPAQLKRTTYTRMVSFVFPGNANAWDMGFEVKNVSNQTTFQADLVQGAGPNKSSDNDNFKDFSGRFEWKEGPIALGCSYYGGTNNGGGFTSYQNWGGAHARFNSEGFDARAEVVFAPGSRDAYFVQAAYKSGDWEPLAWGELGFLASSQNYQVLGGGLNYWLAPKTRLSVNVTFSGVTDFSAPVLGVLQAEQVF